MPLLATALISTPLGTAIVAGLSLVTLMAVAYGAPDFFLASLTASLMVVMPFCISLLIQRLRSERAHIAESEMRFRTIMENSPIGMMLVGADKRWMSVNRSLCEMLGYSEGEEKLLGLNLTHPDDLAATRDVHRRLFAGEINSVRFEKRYLRKDGSVMWALVAGAVVQDDRSGQPPYAIIQVEDITERRNAQLALAASEGRFRKAMEHAPIGMALTGLDSRFLQVNQALCDMLGYEAEELLSLSFRDLTFPADLAANLEEIRRVMAGEIDNFQLEKRYIRKDGSLVWVKLATSLIRDEDTGAPVHFISQIEDVTEYRALTEALSQEKDRLRVTLESIGDAVISTDPDARITFLNPVAESFTGWSSAEAMGRDLSEVLHIVDEATDHPAASKVPSACAP